MSHLVVVDGHAIAHRAYHSIPPLTVNGQPVNAVYGFFSMLLSAIDILKPDYLIVCLDSPGPNFRNEEFLGYRAKRQKPDKELVSQLPMLPEALKKASISTFSLGGFEADDLIATIAHKSLRRLFSKTRKPIISKITIITGDKDLMQLVDTKINLFVPIHGLSETKVFDASEVQKKLGVSPSQVIDLKALMGDSSDNYPGVSGIGPKAATGLLDAYQDLDNIYLNLEKIKPVLRQKLEKDKENAYLSRKLATLISNIPLKFKLSSAKWNGRQAQNLLPVFEEFHFKSLISRLQKKYPQNNVLKNKPTNKDPNQISFF